jgi:hypothetical protein
VRSLVNELWNRLAAHNRAHPIPDHDKIKVTFYLGQNVERSEPEPGSSPLATSEIESSATSAGATPAADDEDDDKDEGEDET